MESGKSLTSQKDIKCYIRAKKSYKWSRCNDVSRSGKIYKRIFGNE